MTKWEVVSVWPIPGSNGHGFEVEVRETIQGGNDMEAKMTYAEMVEEARKRALNSGTFTDNPEEKADDVYLVKDIDLVVKAFLKDIEAGDTAEYSEPAEFLDKHDIEWE